jgi:hypothetical protein
MQISLIGHMVLISVLCKIDQYYDYITHLFILKCLEPENRTIRFDRQNKLRISQHRCSSSLILIAKVNLKSKRPSQIKR